MNTTLLHITILTSIAIVLILVSACGSGVSTETATDQTVSTADVNQTFWNILKITGEEAEAYASLNEMATQADTVVVGEFIDFAESRQIVGDAPEDVVTYAAATLSIKEVIRGDIVDDQLPIEFLLPQTPDQVEKTITNLATQMPSGDMLLFLQHKGGTESGLYRLVNSTGLWIPTASDGVTAPLAKEIYTDHESTAIHDSQDHRNDADVRYADELTTITSFPNLVDYVRN